ncbi:hypothetical protein DL240_09570 [Lujinxingia litoralis]|uniref:Lipoprotein n=1 Tax=Lujinxingia litoralis TaxID=2211119 RepID=A0A328C685_9DELT|nr:hypothetical protein [Lujinxingia litoralis]RAL23121.1 hypothetical protein DL240_09570 [Lujinxingia litoralis]
MRQDMKKWLGFTMVASSVMACGHDDGKQVEAEPQPVDHAQVRLAVGESVSGAMDSVAEGLAVLSGSDLFHDYVWSMASGDCGGAAVPPEPVGGDGEIDEPLEPVECDSSDGERFEMDLSEERDEIRRVLEEYVFVEGNIEAESETEVTYLLRGEVVCAEEEDELARAECEADVDALELRLVASSWTAEQVRLEVQVGPERIEPVTLEFSPSSVEASAALGEVRRAALYMGEVRGDDLSVELPQEMSGELLASFSYGEGQAALSVEVLEDVAVAGDGFALQLARTPELFSVEADRAEDVFGVRLGLAASSLLASTGEVEECTEVSAGSLEVSCEVVEEGYSIGAEIAALAGELKLFAAEDRFSIQDLTLGQGPARVSVEGQEVATLNFNAAFADRSLNANVHKDGEDIAISMSPGLDLELMLALYRAQDVLGDVEEWMLDDVLTLVFDNDASPALRIGEAGVKVERGELTLRSEAAELEIGVSAGMCIGEVEPAEESAAHPFSAVGEVACQE